MGMTLTFDGGTLVLSGAGQNVQGSLPAPFRWISGRWRCEAIWYASLVPWLREQQVRDLVPRWQPLHGSYSSLIELHPYQEAALEAWEGAGRRGTVVLPTGAGKSLVALHAIHRANRSAIIIAPTIDLMHAWYSKVSHFFPNDPIGVYYGAEKKPEKITITTYHSSGDLIAELGNTTKLLIGDEAHHWISPSWSESALMAPAPFRLGLTATYPTVEEQTAPGHRCLEEIIGPLVYAQQIKDLVGEQLAQYRTMRVRVALTKQERHGYEADYHTYMGFVRQRKLLQTHGALWLRELMALSTKERPARAAFLARQRIGRLLSMCEGKLEALDRLLLEHAGDQVLVFTEDNTAAYHISRQHLVPAITHESEAEERKHILEEFQKKGLYRVIVSSKVLNEGVDIPSAKVAIILGGGVGAREQIQRLGRILRKHANQEAILYEVLARDTIEEGKVQRRRAAQREEERRYADG
jgi:superfamily II DNA or RNA helicase